jgi:hypothetical protein
MLPPSAEVCGMAVSGSPFTGADGTYKPFFSEGASDADVAGLKNVDPVD